MEMNTSEVYWVVNGSESASLRRWRRSLLWCVGTTQLVGLTPPPGLCRVPARHDRYVQPDHNRQLVPGGEGIYEQIDKALVIEEGRMIYQGPVAMTKQYITTADFPTSIRDPNERQFRNGLEASTPKTATELEIAFRNQPFTKTRLLALIITRTK